MTLLVSTYHRTEAGMAEARWHGGAESYAEAADLVRRSFARIERERGERAVASVMDDLTGRVVVRVRKKP